MSNLNDLKETKTERKLVARSRRKLSTSQRAAGNLQHVVTRWYEQIR